MIDAMKDQAAKTVIDAKTVLGIGAATGGGVITAIEVTQLGLTIVSIFVGIATFIYICMGIRNRHQEHKLMKKKEEDQF